MKNERAPQCDHDAQSQGVGGVHRAVADRGGVPVQEALVRLLELRHVVVPQMNLENIVNHSRESHGGHRGVVELHESPHFG